MDYLETLLEPISDERYCGENLEDDAAFQNFFFTAQGTPERYDGENTIDAEPPDWHEIEKQALVFLEQTKDLKLICILAQSVLNTKGLVPFSQCIQALSRLLRKQWEEVYPLLDEDDNDPLERVASFSNLNHPFITTSLKNSSLANVKGVGDITLADIELAEAKTDDASLSVSQLKAIFREINTEQLQLFHDALAYSLESLEDINSCFVDNAGHEYTVDFTTIVALLESLKTALENYSDLFNESESRSHGDVEGEGQGDDESSPGLAQGKASSKASKIGAIQSREDVERCLNLINEYYSLYEPSSPLPVLVNRAIKLVHADFLTIVQDIYPDALPAVQQLAGIDPDGEEKEDDEW
ncbi:type VI secretion system protein TssA [Ningiella sp. W23]|uniref:type VI secretion system protein TssA n=1 Tax=Ningiella sp. W23 TaxID=3023715 RepID=UPI003757E862